LVFETKFWERDVETLNFGKGTKFGLKNHVPCLSQN
jgi:hypothetical protein